MQKHPGSNGPNSTDANPTDPNPTDPNPTDPSPTDPNGGRQMSNDNKGNKDSKDISNLVVDREKTIVRTSIIGIIANVFLAAFKAAVEGVKARGIESGICSCGASAALLNDEDMQFDMVRPGIITYGYYPDEITKEYLQSTGRDFDIKPVLSLETKVVAIRRFPAGKSVSYGRTWVAPEETDIAVLPIGYADGLLRRFSPGLEVTINGKNYPVRGRICMDQCMVDIGKDNPDVKVWDRVVVFGPKESGALNTAEDLAKLGNTISYEVLTALSKRVRREIL
jgi:alanine racemase